eukprot:14925362-Alexandrium_andersonii.AAC.1
MPSKTHARSWGGRREVAHPCSAGPAGAPPCPSGNCRAAAPSRHCPRTRGACGSTAAPARCTRASCGGGC